MGEVESEQKDKQITTKTHEKILTLIEEIKTFEEKFREYDIVEPKGGEEPAEVEFIPLEDVEPVVFEETKPLGGIRKISKLRVRVRKEPLVGEEKPLESEGEVRKAGLKTRFRNILLFGNEEKLELEGEHYKTEIPQSSLFKVRFDKDGNLVFLGIKKFKPKPTDTKSRISSILKKISLKRKGKTEKSGVPKEAEGKSRFSKLKGGIGKIKGVIPGRGKKKEETEEAKTEESEKTE